MSQSANPMYTHAQTWLQKALDNRAAEFRDGQWQAIQRLVENRAKLLVVQRTGWGKSLVYFLATRLLRDRGAGPTLIISPLLSLMRNQIEAAQRIGIRAATINSSNRDDWKEVQSQLRNDEIDVLLISPERLANDEFRDTYLLPIAGRIGLFVIDEAHCISDWGHDFRPDYRRIVRILQALPPNSPILATTATANNRVVADITAIMGNIEVQRGTLNRDSLRLQTINLPSQAARMAWLATYIPQLPLSGIVYTLTVNDCERVANWLTSRHINAAAYHGGIESAQREELEQRLLRNNLKVLVATTALGMGFDKPDLGFVIHFQRPSSVVHYYQQVGRAGRAVHDAFGIMLSGTEDDEIADYFIRTAFPPEAHTQDILDALEQADDGLTLSQIEAQVNLSYSQIEKALKQLSITSPAPIVKQGSRWYITPVTYTPDRQKIIRLTELRKYEQQRMHEYLHSTTCLMQFLAHELDDPMPEPCGCCAVCNGAPIVPLHYNESLMQRALQFLRRTDRPIEPRLQWKGDALALHGWSGRIPKELQAEPGRVLSMWGDAGWGTLVKQGKQQDVTYDQVLVDGLVELITTRWQPNPSPTWVTCVPSITHPTLVPELAKRLATALNLPFHPCVHKVRANNPQKQMHNSYQQSQNLAGAFEIHPWGGMSGPVLLVDDMIDSGWTFTVISALLRSNGSGPVFPVALAKIQTD
jgi:ATP-dependent DNA helicase RecQ